VSDHLQESFYGDLFLIGTNNVAIFGFGKTRAARIAAGNQLETELVTDHLLLRRDGKRLLAHLDLARHGEDSPLPRWHVVHAFARCLREDETKHAFAEQRTAIREVDIDTFIRASRWNIGYPLTAETLEERLAERSPLFRKLVEGAVTQFVLVPWMATLEEKADLLRSYFHGPAMHAHRS
jgi:hypothetical protein